MQELTVIHLKRAQEIALPTWVFALTLGLWFGANASGSFDPTVLFLPAVIVVAVIISTIGAIVVFPLALWASRAGWRNIRRYGPVLWVVMAVYIFIVKTSAALSCLIGLFSLGALGLVVIGLIPPREPGEEPTG